MADMILTSAEQILPALTAENDLTSGTSGLLRIIGGPASQVHFGPDESDTEAVRSAPPITVVGGPCIHGIIDGDVVLSATTSATGKGLDALAVAAWDGSENELRVRGEVYGDGGLSVSGNLSWNGNVFEPSLYVAAGGSVSVDAGDGIMLGHVALMPTTDSSTSSSAPVTSTLRIRLPSIESGRDVFVAALLSCPSSAAIVIEMMEWPVTTHNEIVLLQVRRADQRRS